MDRADRPGDPDGQDRQFVRQAHGGIADRADEQAALWLMFVFLSMNVAVLNVVAGHEVFVFLPALAGLSSLAFTALTCFVSRRFTSAGILMFVTGILIARMPQYGFLIYGAGWFIVLETLGLIFLFKRPRWLPRSDAAPAPPLRSNGNSASAGSLSARR